MNVNLKKEKKSSYHTIIEHTTYIFQKKPVEEFAINN